MESSPISALPPEVLHQILKYLPIATLLRFGRTSRRNYSAATLALKILRLAILPRQLHGVLAFLSSSTFEEFDIDIGDTTYDNPFRNQIIVPSPLPPFNPPRPRTKPPSGTLLTPAQYRDKLFQLQNALACSILSTPTLGSLNSLSLYIYHITSPSLTEVLATLLPSLRELRLNFYHPYLHDTCLPAQYWTNPVYLQPSPIWNALAGIGDRYNANLKLKKLEKLTIERAGINSFQLRKWVECNPNLRELRLRNVAGVDLEFVQWLGTYYGYKETETSNMARPGQLKILALENCSNLVVGSVDDLRWLGSLFEIGSAGIHHEDKPTALDVLSLRYSTSISTTAICAYLESHRPSLLQLTLPDGHILVPIRQKRSRSGSSTPHSDPLGRSKHKKRPRTRTLQASSTNQHEVQSHDESVIEVEPGSIGIQALNIDESQSGDGESSDDDDTFSSPVSYLLLRSRTRPRTNGKFMPNDIIEPDPDAI